MKRFFAGLLMVSMTLLFGCGGGSGSSTPSTYKITGTVKDGGNGIKGVAVSTGNTSTTTDSNGNYTLSPLTSGSYTVIPALAGYIFTPATLTVSVIEADSAGNNFTGSVIQRKITGMVKIGGNAIAGVTVGNGSTSAITDANGNYTLNTTSNGSYTVTPILAGCTFTPPTLSVAVNGADSTGNNFSGTIPVIQRNSVGNIVGIQKDTANSSVAGATAAIVVNGVTYTATSDANGVYDLILPANITQYLGDTFSYSVSKAGYIPISYTGNINTSIFQSTTPLVAGDNSYIVLEIPPLTHHLGDSSYSGAANSQFQYPNAEALTWVKSFALNTQPSQFQSATISFKAKGIQYPDTVTVNSTVFQLANSDPNGGYSDYSITVPLNAFKANSSNTITISSALGSDYDDFEFLNVIIKFSNDSVGVTGTWNAVITPDPSIVNFGCNTNPLNLSLPLTEDATSNVNGTFSDAIATMTGKRNGNSIVVSENSKYGTDSPYTWTWNGANLITGTMMVYCHNTSTGALNGKAIGTISLTRN